jgi:hypothetical protein
LTPIFGRWLFQRNTSTKSQQKTNGPYPQRAFAVLRNGLVFGRTEALGASLSALGRAQLRQCHGCGVACVLWQRLAFHRLAYQALHYR